MDGEAGGKIELPPLVKFMGVGRQQQQEDMEEEEIERQEKH